ncbi:MAG: YggU family protein [Gemmatimonadaceae bacterium]|nr:YggU family protein [Gemmatimonadaceae bacterium]NUO95226.1 YggU family protein [Gemmatimonadaceae bacterium]NUP55334.1 YggU family protein [Gemmatimonadaceae bacterium]NUS34625.1 YggU family protein [Gemmatimonadaceae bacterium]
MRTERRGASIRVRVHVQPRASRSEVVGTHGTALKVRVHAPPVDGAANDAVISLLSAQLGVPRRAIRIVSGAASRAKTVDIEGTTEAAVRALATGGNDTN